MILLISPPFYRLQGSHFNGMHLGLSYLASSLKQHGIECKIYNADYLDSDNFANQVELHNSFDTYKTITVDHGHSIWDECMDNIVKANPEWVGFTMFTANFPAIQILSKKIKEYNSNIRIVIGGPHVTLTEGGVLKELPHVDYALCGEAEFSLPLLIRKIGHKMSGSITNLDILPFPDRQNHLAIDAKDMNSIITSRGCPNNCSFCASPVIWKRKVRFRSIENIIQELREIESLGIKQVQFHDDTFSFQETRFKDLLTAIKKENFNFTWSCTTRLTHVNEEILHLMKDAGCDRIKVGVESGNKEMLKKINKQITPKLILKQTKLIQDIGIPLTIYLMLGFPDETNTQALDTISIAKKINPTYSSLSVVVPYFGTELYNNFINPDQHDKNKKHWEYFFHQTKEMILTDKIKSETIEQFWNLNDRN